MRETVNAGPGDGRHGPQHRFTPHHGCIIRHPRQPQGCEFAHRVLGEHGHHALLGEQVPGEPIGQKPELHASTRGDGACKPHGIDPRERALARVEQALERQARGGGRDREARHHKLAQPLGANIGRGDLAGKSRAGRGNRGCARGQGKPDLHCSGRGLDRRTRQDRSKDCGQRLCAGRERVLTACFRGCEVGAPERDIFGPQSKLTIARGRVRDQHRLHPLLPSVRPFEPCGERETRSARLVPQMGAQGLEPWTYGLKGRCSTD
jgi:hypothetical protein